jgi:hypothetical protein
VLLLANTACGAANREEGIDGYPLSARDTRVRERP